MEIMATVVSGVGVFVIGQIIVKFFIDPIIAFKEHVGAVQHVIASNQWSIMSLEENIDLGKEVEKCGALLMVKKRAIPFYKILSRTKLLPSEREIEEGHHTLMILGRRLERTGFVGEIIPGFGNALLIKLRKIFGMPEVIVMDPELYS